MIGNGPFGSPIPEFWEYKEKTDGKAWMKPDTKPLSRWDFPSLDARQTPLEVIEVR